jgi:hypothetical protein
MVVKLIGMPIVKAEVVEQFQTSNRKKIGLVEQL